MSVLPSFEAFFCAVHPGREPFPWQTRLAQQVLAQGWPSLLDIPTGGGKTSALDVAVYALACAPDRMPRRTLLVIDRRIVVDQGAEHARGVLALMQAAEQGPARELADRLRSLWGASRHDPPFAVAVLRGGMPRDNDWARRPDQPIVGVSTVDQVGSRLLFRGYGVSPRSASIHAGLLGNDTLLLLDEVHLAEPFAQTLAAVQQRYHRPIEGLPHRFGVVHMSATPGAAPGERFGLNEQDRAHPVLSARLKASKKAVLRPVRVTGDDEAQKRKTMAHEAVAAALSLQKQGARVVAIVVNRVDTARVARALLDQHSGATEALLLTGRMRPMDRDLLVRTVLTTRCGPRDARDPQSAPLVVVATQCIEAGADLDFDALVTECASLDALRQRFGRLDRQGRVGASQAVILGRSDIVAGKEPDPVYGNAIAATWEWLSSVATDGVVPVGIEELPQAVAADGSPRLDLLSPRPDAPVLLPSHLDVWAQTAPLPDYDPDVALWLHGPEPASADVQLVWRADLELPNADDGVSLDRAIRLLSAFRPCALEALSVPIGAARRWLAEEADGDISDVVFTADDPNGEPRRRQERQAHGVVALRWKGEDSTWLRPGELRPGDVVVVPARRGGIAHGTFDPSSPAHVTDLGVAASLRSRAQVELRLQHEALRAVGLPDAAIASMPIPEEEETSRAFRERMRAWAAGWPQSASAPMLLPHEWTALRRTLEGRAAGRVHRDTSVSGLSVGVEPRWLKGELEEAVTEDDDSSFTSVEITLRAHCEHVETQVRAFARSLHLSESLVDDLALAARLHDAGKADPRFQRWLVGGSEIKAAVLPEPLAKSTLQAGSYGERVLARKRAGYPAGYRHELLSLAMLQSTADALSAAHDAALVRHLVASHHGHCRPFAPLADDPDALQVHLRHGHWELQGCTRHRFASLDSGVSEAFWDLSERYGWWGLAWLEAILRLADHRASASEKEGA